MSEDKFESGEWEMQGDEHLLTCHFCNKEDRWVHLKVWKNLTDAELREIRASVGSDAHKLLRALEQRLKELNFYTKKGETE